MSSIAHGDPEGAAPLRRALDLARRSFGLSNPNPAVGCVITRAGEIIGEGHTQQAGRNHAEIEAIVDAHRRSHDVAGATAHVTLEPCSHYGRTPPCCDALVRAQIAHVVVAQRDPNPLVAGRGIERLRAAGVAVTLLQADDPLALAARELNLGFYSRMVRQTPWVRMKIAASLDGRTALNDGTSQWITSEAARTDGQAWRARAGTVLTGVGTILADDPRLDARSTATVLQPTAVVVDSNLQTPPSARIFDVTRQVIIYTAVQDARRWAPLEASGATVVSLNSQDGRVDLSAMLRDLATREVNDLHVEAGSRLNGSLVRAGLVDEFLLYLAPKLLGEGLGMAQFGPLEALTDAIHLRFTEIQPIGPDLRILARIPGRDNF